MDGPCLAKIPFKLWLKLNDPEYEVFRRSSNMIYDFVSEVKAPPTGKVVEKLINLDEALDGVFSQDTAGVRLIPCHWELV